MTSIATQRYADGPRRYYSSRAYVPLYRHQEVPFAWMKQMEGDINKGGILADEMGLGKTVSTLALILANQATSRWRTNLIIGPLSLLRQWEEEIKNKIKPLHALTVFIYHGKKADIRYLLKFDVVVTTYGTLVQEFERYNKFRADNRDRTIDLNDRSYAANFPLFHSENAIFHRVILDEAHCIKNRNTQTAQACRLLRAAYRWCLTGTPMMNGVLELYSLLKFLRVKQYRSWEDFHQVRANTWCLAMPSRTDTLVEAFGLLFGERGDPRGVAMNQLRALLKTIMLRRKKNSKLDGKPILQLPQKTEHILKQTERDFYKQLEEKSQVTFNEYLRNGTVGRDYSHILVLLLRLRQACCHPHLNLDVNYAMSHVRGAVVGMKGLCMSVVARIKEIEAFDCPICSDAAQSPLFFVPCGHHSCSDCLLLIMDNATQRDPHIQKDSEFNPRECFTYELFKEIHMAGSAGNVGPTDDAESCNGLPSLDDLKEAPAQSCGGLDMVVMQPRNAGKNDGNKENKSNAKASTLKSLRLEAAKNPRAYELYMDYLRQTWMPAAKVTECIKLLKRFQGTGAKTIVFSQWTLLLDLVQVAMLHDHFPTDPLRYDGSMSNEKRSMATKALRDSTHANVMLVSLRAGNAGLNLTAATRVVIMDPFWNPYIEMQAIDRTHRIGQQREVEVYRILTKETVEDRIVHLQNKKKQIVEAALDKTGGMKFGRLDEDELNYLFNSC
ncbi:putative ATP-dependent helicase C23E6.02 [Metarhizium anisopliae]